MTHSPADSLILNEAVRRWEQILRIDPDNEVALWNLGANYLSVRNTDAAATIVDRFEQLSEIRDQSKLYIIKARLSALLEDYHSSLIYWQNARACGADTVQASIAIVNCALHCSDLYTAHTHLQWLSKTASQTEDYWIARARYRIKRLKYQQAKEILYPTESFVRNRKAAIRLLFQCYMHQYAHSDALALCHKLDELEDSDALLMTGKVYCRLNLYECAIQSFESNIQLHNCAESKVWLVKSLYLTNNRKAALKKAKSYERSLNHDYVTKARCWESAGHLTNARRTLIEEKNNTSAAIELVKHNYRYRNWGRAYSDLCALELCVQKRSDIVKIKRKIESACHSVNERLPATKAKLKRFKFFSNEAMVRAIVDKIVSATPSAIKPTSERAANRVILVINSLGPGGAERQIVNLANGLARSGTAVELICTHLDRTPRDSFYRSQLHHTIRCSSYYDRNIQLDPDKVPGLSGYEHYVENIQPFSRQQLILHLARKLESLQPTIVHAWLDETLINTALVCGMLKVSVVVGRWGSMPPGIGRQNSEIDQNNNRYLNYAYQQITRLSNVRFTCNSVHAATAYANLLKIDRSSVAVVYNGIDDTALQKNNQTPASTKSELNIPADSIVIGTVIRLSEEKRPELWLQIARELSALNIDIHFIIVGTGPLESTLKSQVMKTGLRNIHLLGARTDVGKWLNIMDIFMLTSRVEGVSNAVIEAQLCGCAVVVPNVGGLREALSPGHTGELLEHDDAATFVKTISELVRDKPRLFSYSQRARAYATQKFSVTGMVNQYQHIYLESVRSARTDL